MSKKIVNRIIVITVISILALFVYRYWKSGHVIEEANSSLSTNQPIPQHQGSSKRKAATNKSIPPKAYSTWDYIRRHHKAPPGYVGGRPFKNLEKKLPVKGPSGKLRYLEWDVNPKIAGKNRGPERLVSQAFNQVWYTSDHYKSFTELIPSSNE